MVMVPHPRTPLPSFHLPPLQASNFLSTLHRTKAQLKKAVGGPESAAPGAGGPGQGPAGLLGAEGSASMSQRLHGKMDKLKDMGHALGDKLGDKLDRMKEGMEDKMDKVSKGGRMGMEDEERWP